MSMPWIVGRIAGSSFIGFLRLFEGVAADVDDMLELRRSAGEFSAVQGSELVGAAVAAAIFSRFQESAFEGQLAALSTLVAAALAVFVDRQNRGQCSHKLGYHLCIR